MKMITPSDGERLAKEVGAAAYVECSAKTMKGVNDVFDRAVRCVELGSE